MAAKNDITGDKIKSKTGNQKAYADGWDRIFGKYNPQQKGLRTPINSSKRKGSSENDGAKDMF